MSNVTYRNENGDVKVADESLSAFMAARGFEPDATEDPAPVLPSFDDIAERVAQLAPEEVTAALKEADLDTKGTAAEKRGRLTAALAALAGIEPSPL